MHVACPNKNGNFCLAKEDDRTIINMQDDSCALAAKFNGKPARQGGFSIARLGHVFAPKLVHTSLTRDMRSSTMSLGRRVSSKRMRITPGFLSTVKLGHPPP